MGDSDKMPGLPENHCRGAGRRGSVHPSARFPGMAYSLGNRPVLLSQLQDHVPALGGGCRGADGRRADMRGDEVKGVYHGTR